MAKILGCKHKIIKNAGHISNQEQPEIVTNILFNFFMCWILHVVET
jgi:pimeloyl-ACP methyl ester carboxylesterase